MQHRDSNEILFIFTGILIAFLALFVAVAIIILGILITPIALVGLIFPAIGNPISSKISNIKAEGARRVMKRGMKGAFK